MNTAHRSCFARLSFAVVFPFALLSAGCFTVELDNDEDAVVGEQESALGWLKPKKLKQIKKKKKKCEIKHPHGDWCDDEHGHSKPDMAQPTPDCGPAVDAGTGPDSGTGGTPTVTGTFIDTYVVDTGAPEAKARDLSGANVVIRANVGLVGYTGVGAADGTFVIEGVPLGATYSLEFDLDNTDATPALHLTSAARTLDLGATLLGRADRSGPTQATTLAFAPAATGLAAWADNHQLQLVSSNAGAFGDLLAGVYANGPTAGATSLGLEVGWHTITDGFLIDGSRGDSAIVTQLLPRANASGIPHFTIGRALALAPFTQTDGTTTSVTGAFATVAQSQSINLDWRRSQFDALKTAINPAAFTIEHDLHLRAQPGGLTRGYFTPNSPDLFQFYPGDTSSDLNFGAVAYGNPFPSTWGVVGADYSIFATPVLAPGAAYAIDFYAIVSHLASAATFGAAPVAPSLSPVTNPTIDGTSAFAAQTLATTTPTLAWTAPALGSANAYQVFAYRLDVDGAGNTGVTYAAEFLTTQTSLTIPFGVLAQANYVFYVRAVRAPGVDLSAAPRRLALPYAVADLVTAVVVSPGSNQ